MSQNDCIGKTLKPWPILVDHYSWFEETCNRSVVRNSTSGLTNVLGGLAIGWGIALIPVTGGLSIALVAGGSFIWGMYGGELSNDTGKVIEEMIFD